MAKFNKPDNRLFVGIFPAGISYADRTIEEHGDYKKLAFLPYSTLKPTFYKCPDDLRKEIEEDIKQYKKGEDLQISTCGQSVILGMG